MRCSINILFLTTLLAGTSAEAQQSRPSVPVPQMVQPVNSQPLTEQEAVARDDGETPQSQSTSSTIDTVYEQAFPPVNNSESAQNSFLDEVMKRWQPTQRYAVDPKESIMIPVGQGLMNTISTNLAMLTAKTNDETSTYEIDEGYLYVTVNTKTPISIVLYQEGVLESQVSVTLVPVPAPPTLVEIEFNLTPKMQAKAKKYKADMELSAQINAQQPSMQANTPYQRYISNMLLPVARGDIPRSFALSPSVPQDSRFPCSMSIYHETKQRLLSGKHVIDVVHVVNDSHQTYNVREEMCLGRYVKAVALFEKAFLQPGEESELYILRDIFTQEKDSQRLRRPRLTGIGG